MKREFEMTQITAQKMNEDISEIKSDVAVLKTDNVWIKKTLKEIVDASRTVLQKMDIAERNILTLQSEVKDIQIKLAKLEEAEMKNTEFRKNSQFVISFLKWAIPILLSSNFLALVGVIYAIFKAANQ